MEPLKEFGKTRLTLDNCIIPKERLINTPSAKDGMSKDTEIDIRIKGCECIQSAGLLLKLPQAAMATAQILFQRFYYAKSIVKFKFYYAAMASLFLASKIEECNRRLRDVLNVFYHLKQKRKGSKIVPMDYVGEEYFSMRNTVNKYERYILKELGFCVHVQHPHKLVISCLQLLELERNGPLVQKAWNFMNDGLRTNIFVRFEVHTIACACTFLAARQMKIPLPENPPWWKLFNVRFKDMKSISLELLALEQRKVKSLHELEQEVESLKELLMSQKKVEIKEIQVKTNSDPSPSQSVESPSNQSPASLQEPPTAAATKSTKISPSLKPSEPNPIVEVTYKSSSRRNSRSPVNGYKRDRANDDSSSPSRHESRFDKKPRLAPSSGEKHQRITPEAYRPISSPIKLTSDSSSRSNESVSPLPQQNGRISSNHYTEYNNDSEPSHSRKQHRHKHHRSSSSKHHHHHHSSHHSREKSRERNTRDRSRSRERYPEHMVRSKHGRHRPKDDIDRVLSRTVSVPVNTTSGRSSSSDHGRLRKNDSYYR